MRLSSDLRRVREGVGVDEVVAGGAHHEGLASLDRHDRRPRGLTWPGWSQIGELADLVHQHLARFAAQLTPPGQEPVDQLLTGVGGRLGDTVEQDRALVARGGIPPNRATRSGLPLRWILASKQVRSPYRVSILALCLAAIFDTVDWCLAARVVSIEVSACQRRSRRRQTSVASR